MNTHVRRGLQGEIAAEVRAEATKAVQEARPSGKQMYPLLFGVFGLRALGRVGF